MITTEHRAYAILMMRNAIIELLKDNTLNDESAMDYIKSGYGELKDNY